MQRPAPRGDPEAVTPVAMPGFQLQTPIHLRPTRVTRRKAAGLVRSGRKVVATLIYRRTAQAARGLTPTERLTAPASIEPLISVLQ